MKLITQQVHSSTNLKKKLKSLKQILKVWNKATFCNIHEEKKKIEEKMTDLQQEIIYLERNEDLNRTENILSTQLE